jgi:hypothetical protein
MLVVVCCVLGVVCCVLCVVCCVLCVVCCGCEPFSYSGLHPKQGYHSPGTKKTYVVCIKYVHRHTLAMASSCQPRTTNKRTMAIASGF